MRRSARHTAESLGMFVNLRGQTFRSVLVMA
jgi:hypothetical protein